MKRAKDVAEISEENVIVWKIKELLEKMSLQEGDFKGKIGTVKRAHKKVTDEVLSVWRETNGFGKARAAFTPRGGTYGIDIVGRDWERGKILLAMEVDTWFRPYPSWMKLLDIRSENKVWVYLTNDKKAEENFAEAITEINALLKSRGGDKTTIGDFVAFMRTPTDLRIKRIM